MTLPCGSLANTLAAPRGRAQRTSSCLGARVPRVLPRRRSRRWLDRRLNIKGRNQAGEASMRALRHGQKRGLIVAAVVATTISLLNAVPGSTAVFYRIWTEPATP